MKGILLIALGHPYYGRMAYNLAMSLKFSNPDIDIALACNKSAIQHLDLRMISFFSHVIDVPADYYTKNGNTEYIKAKTYMYELSPFEKTIFLDVDTVWVPSRKISDLFKDLKGLEFQNRGFCDLNENIGFSDWCDLNELKEVYGSGKYYDLSSEFVYFEKNKKTEKFFKTAIEVYDNIKIKSRAFAGGIPDELAFSISMIINKTYPSKDNYMPIYWEHKEKKYLQARDVYDNYYLYSVGGASNNNHVKKFYNNLIRFYGNHYGVQYTFPLLDKRQFLPERTSL